jgi:hypothetical protein
LWRSLGSLRNTPPSFATPGITLSQKLSIEQEQKPYFDILFGVAEFLFNEINVVFGTAFLGVECLNIATQALEECLQSLAFGTFGMRCNEPR